MEIGNIALNNHQIGNTFEQSNKIAQIKAVNPTEQAVENSKKAQDTNSINLQNNLLKTSEIQNIQQQQNRQPIEFLLSNTNFGFNSKSGDFYVKVERGDAINKYPTDEMMKIKASLKEQAKISQLQ